MNFNYIISILVLILYVACSKVENKIESKNPPNIIFIMADDHAKQAISAYGHEIGKLAPTPNIDKIATEGVIFNNNFCTNSLCGPSRAVILTGKHSHENGFRMNGERFDGSQQTFPKLLQQAGYTTALIGKWHLNEYPQGFDYWKILNDQGTYYNPVFIQKNILQTQQIGKMGDTTIIEGYATDIITADALTFLEKHKKSKKPFLLMIQQKAPHRNWMPALRHLNLYDSVQFPVPDSYNTTHHTKLAAQQQLMTIYKDMYEGHDLKMTIKKGSNELAHNPWKNDFDRMTTEQRNIWDKAYQPKNDAMHSANLKGKALATWKLQRYLQDYLATIASVDEGVGKVLEFLEKNNLTQNTIVVYTSDQGFYLGENGWFDKRFMYEESLAMPLVIKYPAKIKKGTVVNALTQNLDFAPTFLEYASVKIPADMQGQSLKPLLDQKITDNDFREAIYYHYYDFPAFHMVKKQYGIRTKQYKLIHFYDDIDTWELYDLKSDPKEQLNLFNNKAYAEIQQQLLIKLNELQKKYKVTAKEFEKTPKEIIDNNYLKFKKLRGETN
jgi:uncharacterized sulfatase